MLVRVRHSATFAELHLLLLVVVAVLVALLVRVRIHGIFVHVLLVVLSLIAARVAFGSDLQIRIVLRLHGLICFQALIWFISALPLRTAVWNAAAIRHLLIGAALLVIASVLAVASVGIVMRARAVTVLTALAIGIALTVLLVVLHKISHLSFGLFNK